MHTPLIEACADSYASCRAAWLGGADRLELCAHLVIGGTTPSTALFRQVQLFSALLSADPTYSGTPSALSAKIDPDGSLGITPKKITRLALESVAALREKGILADTYRSNGKRWISLKRADRADFLPVKTIGTIDPAGVASACIAP